MSPDGWSRRKPAIADRDGERRSWADSAPTGVALRRTGVRAKAVVPLRARNRLHRPEPVLIELPTEHREGRRTAGRGHPATQVHGEWGERQCRSASICWYRNFELCPANVGGARRSSVRPAPNAIRCPSCRAKGPLFDFIVDASDERRRQRNAKRPSSGGIDRQTEQVGLIDRQITRLCAFEDFVDKARKAPRHVRILGGIRHQAAGFGKPLAQAIVGRRCNNATLPTRSA
jgi:hypothetical protein